MKKKRILSLLPALVLCLLFPSVFGPVSQAANVILIGDVDGSGSVTKDDVTCLSRYIAGWVGYDDKVDMEAADVNRDGKVTKADGTILARYMAGWDGYDMYINTLFVKSPLTIVKEPLDVEMNAQSAVLSITVSGEFDSIVYEWQKKTVSGWRDVPTLNSDDATYTVNNSALQIISKNGTGGFGEYRCVVSAFYKKSLVAQVISRTATVDPLPEPLKASLSTADTPGTNYYYYYHTWHHSSETDEESGLRIAEQVQTRILKNYQTEERFRYMITPLRLLYDEYDYEASGYHWFYSEDGYYKAGSLYDDSEGVYQDDNGNWWIIPAANLNYFTCSIASVSGGKGPYTYTWYLSDDRFGNDFKPLIEGCNCTGQGTKNIKVWPFEPNKGKNEPYFMGFLCCRVTDAKGRTTNACYSLDKYSDSSGDLVLRLYPMVYALDENNHWFDSPTYSGLFCWTYDHTGDIGKWW